MGDLIADPQGRFETIGRMDTRLVRSRMSEPHRGNKPCGFTLVELITIIVILGIVSLVVLPRFTANDAFQERAAADQVTAALRYAQKVAIASHAPVTVNISRSAKPDCAITVVAGVINCSVSDHLTLGGDSFLVFDFLGRPTPNGAAVTVATTTITIEAETGYVH